MYRSLEQAIRQKTMITFEGVVPPADVLERLRRYPVGGVSLFRHMNVRTPGQVRELSEALQFSAAQGGHPRLLIGTDQEGGQLMAIGEGTTPFPGNMALGATGSPELAYQTGYALARELAAMGLNINYAPSCDVNRNPRNPVVGTRSFGEDPALVARLGAAMIQGIQAAGVAATAKHFPGHGDTTSDSHYGVPSLPFDLDRLRQVELPPFAAAIQAGVRLVMTSHIALPALQEGALLPATLSPAVLRGLLRQELGFQGLVITDAMDMHAIHQGAGLLVDTITALAAGVDLLLLKHSPEELEQVQAGLLQAVERRLISPQETLISAEKILQLKNWLGQSEPPPLEVVGCEAHHALAREIARRSITLVRDRAGLLPLRPAQPGRLAVVVPRPQDLTPADTSSTVTPTLAQALHRYHTQIDEFILPIDPAPNDLAGLLQRAHDYTLWIVGTINACDYPGQAALIQALLERGIPTVMVALRMPYDLQVCPQAPTYLCTYSLLEPVMHALAGALFGQEPLRGRLPVTIPGLSDLPQDQERPAR